MGYSSSERELCEPIENLRNLGPTSAAWLREAGITTISELSRLGPVVAYRLVKTKRPKASLNLLWALAAGLLDVDRQELIDEERARLRTEIEEA